MRVRGVRGAVCLVAAVAAVAACAIGTAFVRPAEDFVRLGETTRAQVIERFGKPDDEQHRRRDEHTLTVISYTYSNNAEATKVPNTLCVRMIEFTLSGDVVVGESFASACASDHTDFDEHKARDIVKDKTRCDEVVAVLGRPAGRAVYPVAREKGEMYLAYHFLYAKRPLLQLNLYQKVLGIGCSADRVVRETEFMERGTP
jgi:hypothetical protein